jgi:xenotropic and polytropic retrovirus receptor 1
VARANATTPSRPQIDPQRRSPYGTITSPFSSRSRGPSTPWKIDGSNNEHVEPPRRSPAPLGKDSQPESEEVSEDPLATRKTPPMAIPKTQRAAEAPGITASSPNMPFTLPGPAVPHQAPSRPNTLSASQRSASIAVPQNAFEVGPTTAPRARHASTFAPLLDRFPPTQNAARLRRMFTSIGPSPSLSARHDINMVAIDQVIAQKRDFWTWLNSELEKIETFYKLKEDEAGARLTALREQLHKMQDQRTQEIAEAQNAMAIRNRRESEHTAAVEPNGRNFTSQTKNADTSSRPTSGNHHVSWLEPIERLFGEAKAAVMKPHIGSNSKALQNSQISPELRMKSQPEPDSTVDDNRDYIRRPHNEHQVSYRVAKRKLKLALQEFYRGMELLKSYALLNRTAFHKINKKHDKAIDAHPTLRYMSERVNKAWFVQSEVLDGHIHAVEDLYARYFERGNHKIAVGKLKSSQGKRIDQSSSSFRSGILIGTGAVFAIQGVIYGADLLHHPDPIIATQASYLLQIYGGYFLALYLFSWFCFDCSIWTRNKINYAFVFEFDLRNNLDWRQLAEFPAFLTFLEGLFVWLNFSQYGAAEMFIYYPVILIFVTVVIIFFPAPVMFHKSRKWFIYSHASCLCTIS